jgi:trehalose utilization protein
MPTPIRVTVWDENTAPASVYPNGLGDCIAAGLREDTDLHVHLATIDEADQGVPDSLLEGTDVLIWWGHKRHGDVLDDTAARVVNHVTDRGMGLIALHSAHKSKPFMALQGTDGELGGWREDNLPERIYTIEPSHPIAAGLPEMWEIPVEEMYSERFNVRTPDELIFISSFAKGEVFRSGCAWHFGRGRMFYFRPGHETNPTYFDLNVRRVIRNGVHWLGG